MLPQCRGRRGMHSTGNLSVDAAPVTHAPYRRTECATRHTLPSNASVEAAVRTGRASPRQRTTTGRCARPRTSPASLTPPRFTAAPQPSQPSQQRCTAATSTPHTTPRCLPACQHVVHAGMHAPARVHACGVTAVSSVRCADDTSLTQRAPWLGWHQLAPEPLCHLSRSRWVCYRGVHAC